MGYSNQMIKTSVRLGKDVPLDTATTVDGNEIYKRIAQVSDT